ncbi:unnamed protein product [Auanema sp. JU1783]|nr:unnamed protein product [Auanema sp. JU1783]
MSNITTGHRLLVVGGLLLTYGLALSTIYANFPELSESDKEDFKYPRNLEDAKKLGRVLSHYKDLHGLTVLFGVVTVYVLLQSFAIPGSIFLTILSGYLFPFPIAITLVCSCSALGAGVCYLLSFLLGRDLVIRKFPEKITSWQKEVDKQRGNLLSYIVFLRVTPLLPNWFINIASPVIDVPFWTFFWGTFLGVAPPSFLYIQAGSTLEQMTHTNVAWSWNSILLLSFFAIISLIPVLWNNRNKSKKE